MNPLDHLTQAERRNLRRVIQSAWIFIVSAGRMIKHGRSPTDARDVAVQSEEVAEAIDAVLAPPKGKS